MHFNNQNISDFLYELVGFMSIIAVVIIGCVLLITFLPSGSPVVINSIMFLFAPLVYTVILINMKLFKAEKPHLITRATLLAAVTFLVGGIVILILEWLSVKSGEVYFGALLLTMSLTSIIVKKILV